jgi:sulfur-oxidizing protein SoxY
LFYYLHIAKEFLLNTQRRLMMKSSVATAALGTAIAAGLISPKLVMVSQLSPAFSSNNTDDAIKQLFAGHSIEDSKAIKIKAPDIAENGAVVPVSISSDLKGIESISILVNNNATPLIANFILPEGAEAYVATCIKMGKSSDVIAIAKVGDKLYRNKSEVKVTIGGCGG